MIQELLGVGVVKDGKIPFPAVAARGVANLGVASASSGAAPASSTAPPSPVASPAGSSSTTAEQQSLRCPRCDSTNTKFCYYNNYNLTQPRHFCKTCRRYWTQGGALRNVPIGGGCRKAKSTAISLGSGKPIKAARPSPSDVVTTGKSSAGFAAAAATGLGTPSSFGFDHDLPTSSPILWSVPQNSHLLSLLRAAQSPGATINASSTHSNRSPNPNPAPLRNTAINPAMIKEEGTLMVGSHLVPEPSLLINALNSRNINGVEDLLGQVPIGPCNSLWRGGHNQHHLLPHQQRSLQNQNNPLVGENNPSSGIQELIQRLRSTNSSNHYAEVLLGNMGAPPSSSSVSFSADVAASTANNILVEAAAAGGGEFGCWNSSAPFAWVDMPNINGSFL